MGTNAQKLAALENERLNALERQIKAISEKTGTNLKRLDTLDNTSEQQILELKKNFKVIREQSDTNSQRLDTLTNTAEK